MKSIKSFPSIVSTVVTGAFVAILSGCALSPQKDAGDQQIQKTAVDVALTKFYGEATNSKQLVQNAQGVLVCPSVKKAGFVFGGEGGTCSMQIKGITKEYYRVAGFKAGLLAGGEAYSLMLIFNDVDALTKFRDGKRNWQVGGNLSVAVAKKGAQGGFNSKAGAAITGYVYNQSGLMGDISFDGSTFKKLED